MTLFINVQKLCLKFSLCKRQISSKRVKNKISACVITSSKQHHVADWPRSLFFSAMIKGRPAVYLSIPVCHIRWRWTVSGRRTRALAADTVRVFCIPCAWAEFVKRQIRGSEPRSPDSKPRTRRAGRRPQTLSPRLGSGSRKSPAGGMPWLDRRGRERGREGERKKRATVSGERRKRQERERKWLGTWPNSVRNHGVESSCASI